MTYRTAVAKPKVTCLGAVEQRAKPEGSNQIAETRKANSRHRYRDGWRMLSQPEEAFVCETSGHLGLGAPLGPQPCFAWERLRLTPVHLMAT
jgi:hypothetical protein